MAATEDLVSNAAAAAENSVDHATSTTENPINDKSVEENHAIEKADSSENAVKTKAPDGENLASDQLGGAESLANDQSNGAVNNLNDQVGGSEVSVNDQIEFDETPGKNGAGGTGNPTSDPATVAENPITDQACGVENPANDQPNDAVNHVKNQAGSENPVNDQANVGETPVHNEAGGAGNPMSDQAPVAENLVNDQASSAVNSAKDRSVDAENPASGNAGDTEDFVNDKPSTAENVANKKAGDVENPVNNKVDHAETPLNDKESAAENLVEDEADAAETPVISREDRIPEEAKEILKSLADKWEDVLDASALQVIPLKGAMTNEVFQIKWPTTTGEISRKVLVRIYGQGVDIFFDRAHEIRTFEFMSKNGQGPRLLERFTNGRIEEFINARTLSASDLRDRSTSALIAAKMKEFHDLDMPGEKKIYLWDTLRNWLREAKRLSSPKEVEAFYLDTIDKEISILEKELSGADQHIGFCHNDLQYGNIMLDEDTHSVTIIDYEYASYNPVAYDIANHFCEMAANYHTETPHILDYNKYPDVEERQRFVKEYLSSSGEQPSDSELEHLLQEVEKYTLANHLFWGLWGIISAQVNQIDFDYKEYAKQRFQEYWARKPYLLSSDAPSPYNAPEGTGELASTLPSKKNSGIFRKMKRVLGLGLFRSKN
ncbi:probable choline kinase 2 [Lotus japonicus]|uniref:probable choline kinase 2 n=1 Tax=Lotus japonicus TaxID=34305 RepID=UPI00258FF53E|nr:probable choline kinase 2 [Lotus japonicus]